MSPATSFRSTQSTYDTSAGGTVPSGNKIIDMAAWAQYLQPTKTPILNAIPKGNAHNQRIINWGQSQFPAHRSTIPGTLTNNATAITVNTGDGVLFQKNTTAVIYDVFPNSAPPRYDYTTKEIVWLTADPATDLLTVARGQGGTTGIAHQANALIEILPPMEPQNQDHTISPVTRGYQYFNNFARIAGGVKMDRAFQNMPTYEFKGDQLVNDITNEQVRLKLLLEKTLVHGGRQSGSPTTPLPEMFGGFLYFIQTNVYNQAGATLSVPQLESALFDLWNKVDESMAKKLVMSMNTARVFDTFLNPYRRADVNETTATFMTEQVKLRSGTYDIGESRWMPDGVIAIVDFSEMELVPFQGLDWHSIDHPVNGDYVWRSISGDFSLIVKNESAMGLITGFNTDLDQYAGRQFLT